MSEALRLVEELIVMLKPDSPSFHKACAIVAALGRPSAEQQKPSLSDKAIYEVWMEAVGSCDPPLGTYNFARQIARLASSPAQPDVRDALLEQIEG